MVELFALKIYYFISGINNVQSNLDDNLDLYGNEYNLFIQPFLKEHVKYLEIQSCSNTACTVEPRVFYEFPALNFYGLEHFDQEIFKQQILDWFLCSTVRGCSRLSKGNGDHLYKEFNQTNR